MNKVLVSILISTVSVIFSIISLCFAAYRTPELEFDYLGAIIGVQSIIITILIGCQILNYISIKSELRKTVDEISTDKMIKLSKALLGYTDARLSSIYVYGGNANSLDNAFSALSVILESKGISAYDLSLNYTMSKILDYINDMEANDSVEIYKGKKNHYIHLLNQIEHPDKNDIISQIRMAKEIS